MATLAMAMPLAGPSRLPIEPLAFDLDLGCPSALSHKPVIGSHWPFNTFGASTLQHEEIASFIRRRYLETLFIPEELASLAGFVVDVARVDPSLLAGIIGPLLLSVKGIEKRHRQTVQGLVQAIFTDMTSSSISEVKQALREEAITKSGLEAQEVSVIRFAVELRAGSRKVTEGNEAIVVKKLVEELEKREALIQVILLLTFIPLHTPVVKKRKKGRRDEPDIKQTSPLDDPKAALETLLDRLSIWSAMADLNLGDSGNGKGKAKEGEGWTGILQRFWNDILVPSFLQSQPDLCASFHQKVFASPIPASYLPPPPRPVRPSIPSRDDLSRASTASARSISRAPSDVSDQSRPNTSTLHRSVSRTSETMMGQGQEMRRSRSRSVDPGQGHSKAAEQPKRPLIRAPSGKDLFKGREVGLMRRTGSRKNQESLGIGRREDSLPTGLGLLGRKTSDPKKRKIALTETQKQPAAAGTLIFATPAKPRHGNPFAHRYAHMPTPIQEEPSSGERYRTAFIAETPSTNRIANTPGTGSRGVAETPMAGRIADSPEIETEGEDDLGDLMVMTDEEDEEEDDRDGEIGRAGLVPETPLK